jgi:2'-5' RNA ligase
MPQRLRTFVAVDIEPFTRERLRGLQAQLADLADAVNWVEPKNLHLTLAFLGEVDARETPKVCAAVAAVAKGRAPFAFAIAGLGAFPTPRRPKVLVARVTDGAEHLSTLHEAVAAALVETGCYRREERAFTPHVTIGRVKRDGAAGVAATILKFAAFSAGASRVREVRVLASELRGEGPEYTVLSRARLGG